MKQLNCLPIIFDSEDCPSVAVDKEEVVELCKVKYKQLLVGLNMILDSVTGETAPLYNYLDTYEVVAMKRLIEFCESVNRAYEFDYEIDDIGEE